MADYANINYEIIAVWKEFPTERGDKIPLLFPPSCDDCVLFISFNPSFPDELRNRRWIHSYDINTLNTINLKQVIKQEIETQNSLRYFNILRDIAIALHLPWSHLDVFMLRETSQEKAKPKVYDGATKQLTRFGQRQFDLFTKALQISSPKVIVVINALASAIIKAQLRLKHNTIDGCYYVPDDKIKAPFFLSSMLSGQRALDIYNRERLIWHIKQKINAS